MDGHQKGEAAAIMWTWARSWCAMGPWRARDLDDGGVLLGFQVQLLLKTNFVTATTSQGWRPSCITRAATTKCFYISLTIGTTRRSRGVEWGMLLRYKGYNLPLNGQIIAWTKGFIFWGLAIARPRIKPRHSTRPTDSFQSSVGNFFLIPLLGFASSFQSSEIHGDTRYAHISYLRRIFLYTDDWRSRSVIYERSE